MRPVLLSFVAFLSASVNANPWTAISLHPAGATGSFGRGVYDGFQIGTVTTATTSYASLWNGSSSHVNLNPAGATRSSGTAIGPGQQVGFASIGGIQGAGFWTGTSSSWVSLHPTAASSSSAWATDGINQGGTVTIGGDFHGALWSGTSASFIDLNPVGKLFSEVFGVGGGKQVGYTRTSTGAQEAARWSSTSASFLSLHPTSATSSVAFDTDGTTHVGWAEFGHREAVIFSETGPVTSLDPIGSNFSEAYYTYGGFQTGTVNFGSSNHAFVWNGTASSGEDLHLALGAGYTSSVGRGVFVTPTAIYAVGTAWRTDNTQEAMLWTRPVPEPATIAVLGAGVMFLLRSRAKKTAS